MLEKVPSLEGLWTREEGCSKEGPEELPFWNTREQEADSLSGFHLRRTELLSPDQDCPGLMPQGTLSSWTSCTDNPTAPLGRYVEVSIVRTQDGIELSP